MHINKVALYITSIPPSVPLVSTLLYPSTTITFTLLITLDHLYYLPYTSTTTSRAALVMPSGPASFHLPPQSFPSVCSNS